MSAENKVPAIRFKGFSGEWEKKELGDTRSYFTDGNYGEAYPSESDLTDRANGVPFLRGSNLANGFLSESNANYITHQKHSELTSGTLFEDDIVIAVRGSLGALGYVNKFNVGWNINSQLAIIRTDKTELKGSFLIQNLLSSTGQKQILSKNTGTALKQLPIGQLKEISIPVTSIKEQTKIGNYFQQLDTLIAQHQQKHDKLLNLKKALLEKMFPKKNDELRMMNAEGATKDNSSLSTHHSSFNVPEIRFKGFSGEWTRCRAIELCSISTGKNNTQDKVHDGKYPFYVRSSIIERSNNYLFDEEAVLTVGDGVGTGKVYHYVRGKYDLHQRVYRMYDFNGVTGKYFYYYFSNNFYSRVISMTAKTSVDSVRLEMISNMLINLPSIEEQKAIANLLENLDTLINQHQAQLKKLNNIKQACLEKMFV
jgi:type I restriction enzyme S subunit